MTGLTSDERLDWVGRHPKTVLVLMHLPFFLFTASISATGLGIWPAGGVAPLILVAAVAAAQLRHSLAAADGLRPRFWQATLASIVVLTYGALPIYGVTWSTMPWYVIASSAMLLPGRAARPIIAAVLAGQSAGWTIWYYADPAANVWNVVYPSLILSMGGGSLFAVSRLARYA